MKKLNFPETAACRLRLYEVMKRKSIAGKSKTVRPLVKQQVKVTGKVHIFAGSRAIAVESAEEVK
jgi:hypothetical protein